ncbi:DUF6894 family protein [Teichococcus vastitatis]|uniref:DUF6894 family protein n=1 Tax=Teichococcus vastitatis TaxID=2307076 RepID=UPI00130028B1|nr:hypothetical protein [Pseudoroseomonas vastitatis]
MPLYFFHVRTIDRLFQDVEGADFPHLEAAQDEAKTAARQLLAQQVDSDGVLIRNQQFEICDEAGQLLATVPFADAVKLK